MKHKISTVTFLTIFLLSSVTFAQGVYFGGGVGNTFFNTEVNTAWDEIKDISDNATAWKAFIGLSLNDFLNVEGGYRSFGTVKARIIDKDYNSKTTGWDIEALGRIQIAIVDIFGKAGVMFWSRDNDFRGDTSGSDFFYGLGAGVHLGPFGIRAEWESVAISGPENLSMVSLSGTFGF
ncbi:MAG: outer membrane beta-barrel protein [Bacteroidota bacterium]